ncbi:PRC-barrel domain-containing protein [Streptomyces atriruber]|uniref:PRC-barrel domain-containing protein n=1 Tax=Streptomyces atriruber TaxID=545121 RepID=UPI0006E32DED|nr:PRC-barrel domain-containing protein [Streptomyces atriruber]
MMLLSQAVGRPVVSSADAAQVGTVAGLVLAPEEALITAVRLDGVKGGADVVAWADVHAVGPDAVVIGAASMARFASTDSAGSQDLLGKRLLTELGDAVGTLTDVAFDPESGRIDTLLSSRGARIPGHQLLGVGSYAVVVRA